MNTPKHLSTDELDRYRSGLMAADEAARCAAHLRGCPQCQTRAQFGARMAAALAPLPRLAARLPQRPARSLRWPRVFGAGMVTASLALAVAFTALHLGSSQAPEVLPGSVSPQIADAVQNMDFYQWLANHPQMLQQGINQ